jgi:hypothetical protein
MTTMRQDHREEEDQKREPGCRSDGGPSSFIRGPRGPYRSVVAPPDRFLAWPAPLGLDSTADEWLPPLPGVCGRFGESRGT